VTKKVLSPSEPAPAPLPAKTVVPETQPEGTETPQATQESEEAVGYRLQSERDPFLSFVATRTPVAVSSVKTPDIKTPLQRYSLDQLKVVGIISGGELRKALLEDDVGKGYVVSAGDAVGSEGGRIAAIQKDRIIIESTYRDVLGNQKMRQITKRLYVSEEGENP
jgi:type IV pilus assembly protein PilP